MKVRPTDGLRHEEMTGWLMVSWVGGISSKILLLIFVDFFWKSNYHFFSMVVGVKKTRFKRNH